MTILAAPNKDAQSTLSIEDFFYYLYLVIEKNHLFRFLYRNPGDISEKYPSVAKGFKKLLIAQERSLSLPLQKEHLSLHTKTRRPTRWMKPTSLMLPRHNNS